MLDMDVRLGVRLTFSLTGITLTVIFIGTAVFGILLRQRPQYKPYKLSNTFWIMWIIISMLIVSILLVASEISVLRGVT